MNQKKLERSKIVEYFGPFGCDKLEIEDGEICRCGCESVLMVRNSHENKRYCRTHARKDWLKEAGVNKA